MVTSRAPADAAGTGLRTGTELAAAFNHALEAAPVIQVLGRVREVTGTMIRATAPGTRVGELCLLQTPGEPFRLEAEVISFADSEALLSPIGEVWGISSATVVTPLGSAYRVRVGPALLGRVLDGFGVPLDGSGMDGMELSYPVETAAPNPLTRKMISRPLCLGVRAIDTLLTCAEGQRIGVFAAAGTGKSTLLGMLARHAEMDVSVIALIGERGREVREFIERELGEEGLKRAVVVCATSERSPLERVKAGFVATAIAEYFRDQGQRVLLLMDSVTRLARAQREIGLTAGEPPTRRGFPPSVFSLLPRVLERSGMNERGSITAFYAVLVEGDDMNEPIADETRSILDGHIILSRKLAAAEHYPAIDVLASLSRVMHAVVPARHRHCAGRVRELLAKYDEVELLVRLGEYQRGSDPEADAAIERIGAINAFLRQRVDERVDFAASLEALEKLVA